jgi:hypothetical protein
MAEAPARSGPTQITTTVTTIVTAGGAGTWSLLRHIVIANETSGAITVSVGIDTAGSDAVGEHIFKDVSIAAGDSLLWDGFLPLMGHASTPDKLYAICSVTNGATATVGMVSGP